MLRLQMSKKSIKFLESLKVSNIKYAFLIKKEIYALLLNPVPVNSKKLTNKIYFRIRVGDYRVVYQFNDMVLLIIAIAHRKEIYKILDL